MFIKFDARLFYFVAYHSQINGQSERINQNIEIVFRFLINILDASKQWSKTLFCFHRSFNNSDNSTFNEAVYDFISVQTFNLMKPFADDEFFLNDHRFIARLKIFDVMIFAQMNVKYYYEKKHQSFFMKSENFVFIRLHREYDILFTIVLEFKFNQQYAEFFKILEKIGRLVYRLKLF